MVVRSRLGYREPRRAAGASWGIIRVGDNGGWTLEVGSGRGVKVRWAGCAGRWIGEQASAESQRTAGLLARAVEG